MFSDSQINLFYKEILKQFLEKLNKRYETRDGLDSNLIDGLRSKIIDKMKNKSQLFKKLINPVYDNLSISTKVIQVGENHNQIKSEEHNNSENQSDIQDDFRKFQVKKQEDEPKQEVAQQKQQVKQQFIGIDSDSQEDAIKEQKMLKAQKQISLHIVGSYCAKQKKHRAKDERTKLQLDNVFVKVLTSNDSCVEYCFQRLMCDFKKTQGEDIKI